MIKLYNHGGSFNRGCEAIVRSSKKIIGMDIELWSQAPFQDFCYNVESVVNIQHDKKPINSTFTKYKNIITSKLKRSDEPFFVNYKKLFLNSIDKDDVCLSIGGDVYCYRGLEGLCYVDKAIKKRGAKLVLWGASVDPEIIKKSKIARDNFARFDLITARESISFCALKNLNKNTFLFPDPAFQLDTVKPDKVNEKFKTNTVGINLSPLIMDYEFENGITEKSYYNLFKYILNETDLNIALIPHVVNSNDDDRKVMSEIYNKYKNTDRVILLDDCGCRELKWYISKCKFVVAARTHVSIAAYSTCVPTLVMGYSVKSKGIAKDIFGDYDNYVLSVQNLSDENALVKKFKWLQNNEAQIHSHLKNVMPTYCKNALTAGEKIRRLAK